MANETLYLTTNRLQRFLYCNIVIYETNSLRRNPNMLTQNEQPDILSVMLLDMGITELKSTH